MLVTGRYVSVKFSKSTLRQRNEALSALLELSNFLSSALDLEALLEGALAIVLRLFDLDSGRIYLMVDCFNVFNNNVLNRKRETNPGTLYLHNMTFSSNARSGEPNEILNPRIFRFGVRFQF